MNTVHISMSGITSRLKRLERSHLPGKAGVIWVGPEDDYNAMVASYFARNPDKNPERTTIYVMRWTRTDAEAAI